MTQQNSVVVTGIGTINPVGNNITESKEALFSGKCGIDKITLFDASEFRSQVAGEVSNFEPSKYFNSKEIRRQSRFIQFGLIAAEEAIKMSGVNIDNELSLQSGVVVGSGIGGLPEMEKSILLLKEKGPSRLSPFVIPMIISNMVSGLISIKYKTKGYNVSPVSACTSSNHAIGDAFKIIKSGNAKLMITGGAEASICGIGIGGFAAMHSLSKRNDDPKTSSRPFDKDRDGFVMGEGSGILILEDKEFAIKRGANILCEIIGYGYSSDANHITSPTVEGPYLAMKRAIKDARINADQIDYINAHGTSTPLGDVNEIRAIKKAFGEHSKKLSISSTKSMTGHLLGGSGSIESIFSILAMENSLIPPTINIFNQDEECDLDVTANHAKEKKINMFMSNSFGFGGTNASLIIKKY